MTTTIGRHLIIGLASDRPGAGKSTAAHHLVSAHNFREHSVGAVVKAEVDAMVLVHGFRYEERHKDDFRDGLIWWTRFRVSRSSPDYWLRTIAPAIRDAHGVSLVFPDIRYPPEADCIRDAGGAVVAIWRHSAPRHPGEAETAMDDYSFDEIVDNNRQDRGTRMFAQLDAIVAELTSGRLPARAADLRRLPRET